LTSGLRSRSRSCHGYLPKGYRPPRARTGPAAAGRTAGQQAQKHAEIEGGSNASSQSPSKTAKPVVDHGSKAAARAASGLAYRNRVATVRHAPGAAESLVTAAVLLVASAMFDRLA
jgi:hypothetical protein